MSSEEYQCPNCGQRKRVEANTLKERELVKCDKGHIMRRRKASQMTKRGGR